MPTCAIIYTTLHDNTRRLAESIHGALPRGVCVYMGRPDRAALHADVIFWGNPKGHESEEINCFLKQAQEQKKMLVPYANCCTGGGKDLCAIGSFARLVMERAALILGK